MTTTVNPALTVADLDWAARDQRWLGFGYLRGRQVALTSTDPEAPANPALVADTDRRVIEHANARGWTYDQLFDWCNSKHGRWLADAAFSGEAWSKIVGWRLLDLP